MPALLLQAIKEMYQDEYILMDGDKGHMCVQQVGDISEGIRGAVTVGCCQWGDVPHSCQRAGRLGDRL
eukprot:956112-Pelagomonas_calceolata.AAC.1